MFQYAYENARGYVYRCPCCGEETVDPCYCDHCGVEDIFEDDSDDEDS